MASDPDLVFHTIATVEQAPEGLQKVLDFNVSVFEEFFTPEEHQGAEQEDLETWKNRLSQPDAAIFYVTKAGSTQPLGFIFVIQRTSPEVGHELLHVWLAGIDPTSRGLGIYALLMDKVVAHARDRGWPEMTIGTYPKKFPQMYRILGKNGWTEIGWRDTGDGAAVLFKKAV